MAAGDFIATLIPDIIERQEQVWADPRNNRRYISRVAGLQAILANQTAKVAAIAEANRKGVDVNITWVNTDSITTEAYAESCAPTGTLLETNTEAVALTLSRQATAIKVADRTLWNNTTSPAEQIALLQLAQKKELDEYITKAVLAKAVTFGGTNADNSGVTGWDITAASTYAADAEWNEDMFAKLELQAQLNQFNMPYFIHGTNLWLLANRAPHDAKNDNERDIQSKLDTFNHYFDVPSFVANATANLSLMIDAPAVAFASTNYSTDGITSPIADVIEYRTASNALPGVFYDVTVTTVCEIDGGRKDFRKVFEMKLPKFDLLKNPANYSAGGNTGVLEYYKGTRPV